MFRGILSHMTLHGMPGHLLATQFTLDQLVRALMHRKLLAGHCLSATLTSELHRITCALMFLQQLLRQLHPTAVWAEDADVLAVLLPMPPPVLLRHAREGAPIGLIAGAGEVAFVGGVGARRNVCGQLLPGQGHVACVIEALHLHSNV